MSAADARSPRSPALRYRWIVTDLDGTLVDRNLAIVPRSRAAIQQFRAAGGAVVIATGRSAASCSRFYDELGLDGPAILLNGALITNLRTGEVLHEQRLDPAAWASVRMFIEALPPKVAAVAFRGDRALAVQRPPWVDDYAARDRIDVEQVESWQALNEVSKVMLLCADADTATHIAAAAQRDTSGVTIVMSEVTYIELLPAGVDKGVALRWLADHEQVALHDVAAVGDNPNDLPMLRISGLGAAVGDGHPSVWAAATTVVGACADGAVADVVAIATSPAG